MPVIKCGCDNGGDGAKYQDAKYGKGNRVANPTKDGSLRCTVCGKVTSAKVPVKS